MKTQSESSRYHWLRAALFVASLGLPLFALSPTIADEAAVSATELDELRWQPRWKQHTDLSGVKGRIVQLKFHLREGTLYSFQVGDGAVAR